MANNKGVKLDGRKVRALRALAGLTQARAAKKADICAKTFSMLERGRPVSRVTLELVAQALGVEPDELVADEG